MKKKYFLILIMIICLGLSLTACKKKNNSEVDKDKTTEQNSNNNQGNPNGGEDPNGGENQTDFIFTFESASEISFTKKDDDTVYYLTSSDKISTFIENINKVKGLEQEVVTEEEVELLFMIKIDNVEIGIYEPYILYNNKYYSNYSGFDFINNYNSGNVDKTSTSTGWLPFI